MGKRNFIVDHEYVVRALVPDLEIPGLHPEEHRARIRSIHHIKSPRLHHRMKDGTEVWTVEVEERDKSWARSAGVPILRHVYRTTAAGAEMVTEWLKAHNDERHAERAIKRYLIEERGWEEQKAHRMSRRPFIGEEKVKIFRDWMKHIEYRPDERARRNDWQEHEADATAYNRQLQKVHEVAFLVRLEGDVERRTEPNRLSETERMLYKEVRETAESHGIQYIEWTDVIREREERQEKAEPNSVIHVDLLEARPHTHRVELRITVRARDRSKAAALMCRIVRMEELRDGTTGVVETAEPETVMAAWGPEKEDAEAIQECVREVVDRLGWKIQIGEDVTAGAPKRIETERDERTRQAWCGIEE